MTRATLNKITTEHRRHEQHCEQQDFFLSSEHFSKLRLSYNDSASTGPIFSWVCNSSSCWHFLYSSWPRYLFSCFKMFIFVSVMSSNPLLLLVWIFTSFSLTFFSTSRNFSWSSLTLIWNCSASLSFSFRVSSSFLRMCLFSLPRSSSCVWRTSRTIPLLDEVER